MAFVSGSVVGNILAVGDSLDVPQVCLRSSQVSIQVSQVKSSVDPSVSGQVKCRSKCLRSSQVSIQVSQVADGSCHIHHLSVVECAMGVTPGVVEPTFQSRFARPFPWKPGIADRLRSNPRAVPNVYQTGLVSFRFNLGTQYVE
jgi:hypothetical protein